MTKTIKLDGKDNYLIDLSTGEIVDRWRKDNPNLKLVIQLDDDSTLEVDAAMMTKDFGGQIVVKYNKDMFIIDDGYQPTLVKAGYIVLENYDKEKYTGEDGNAITAKIFDDAMAGLKNYVSNTFKEYENYEIDDDNHMIQFSSHHFIFDAIIDSVTGIVNKNQLRKDNSLPFYPFDKNMDKYCTVYFTIFAERLDQHAQSAMKYNIANAVVKHMQLNMGPQYHFVPQQIKRRVVMAADKDI